MSKSDTKTGVKPLRQAAEIRQEELARLHRQATTPAWRTRKLTNLEHIRAYVASVINRTEKGELDDAKAARLGNLAMILSGIIRASEVDALAARVRELEGRLGSLE